MSKVNPPPLESLAVELGGWVGDIASLSGDFGLAMQVAISRLRTDPQMFARLLGPMDSELLDQALKMADKDADRQATSLPQAVSDMVRSGLGGEQITVESAPETTKNARQTTLDAVALVNYERPAMSGVAKDGEATPPSTSFPPVPTGKLSAKKVRLNGKDSSVNLHSDMLLELTERLGDDDLVQRLAVWANEATGRNRSGYVRMKMIETWKEQYRAHGPLTRSSAAVLQVFKGGQA